MWLILALFEGSVGAVFFLHTYTSVDGKQNPAPLKIERVDHPPIPLVVVDLRHSDVDLEELRYDSVIPFAFPVSILMRAGRN